MRRVYRRELKFRLEEETGQGKGMFLVMTTNAITPVNFVYSVNTLINVQLSYKGVSKVS